MKFNVRQIAAFIGAEVVGEASREIHTFAKIEEGGPGAISFLANPKYTPYIYSTRSSAVIVGKDFEPTQEVYPTLLKVADPYGAFTQLLVKVQEATAPNKVGREDPVHIGEGTTLGENIYLGAYSYIGNHVKIGDGVKIYPHVYIGDHVEIDDNSCIYPHASVYQGCKMGKDCIIHSGAVIGSDGFGFAPQETGNYLKIPQLGIVTLGDQVEIGANTVIDRATMGSTYIEKGVKLDNLIQVAHNVRIGQDTVIAAQTGISGSTRLGNNCMIGGQVGIVGHLHIADGAKIGAQSGIGKSINQPGSAWKGSPAQPYQKQLRSEILYQRLDEMAKQLRQMEHQLAEMNANKA